jgi:hypothetical protein
MADFGHAGLFRDFLVAPGMAASMAFFMTVGKASPDCPARHGAGRVSDRLPAGGGAAAAIARLNQILKDRRQAIQIMRRFQAF